MAKEKKIKPIPGTLGELLAPKLKKEKAPEPAVPKPSVPEPVFEPQLEPERPLTDEEAFQQAVEGIDQAQIYTGKYGQAGDTWMPKTTVEVTKEEVRQKQDQRYFERMIGQLQKRFEDGKYYTPENFAVEDNLREAAMRRFEKASRSGPVPSIDLHDVTVKDLFEVLHNFVLTQQSQGSRFVRVIHGKGKNSKDGPVLRPLVTQWIEGSARCIGFFPEVDVDDDFGVVVVELRRPNP